MNIFYLFKILLSFIIEFQLCFKKGSIITVTQNDDGTWWEGTFDDNTGWFPANYVRPYKQTG